MLELRLTTAPPLGAAALSWMVSVVDPPLVTVEGLTLRLLTVGIVAAVVKVSIDDQVPK